LIGDLAKYEQIVRADLRRQLREFDRPRPVARLARRAGRRRCGVAQDFKQRRCDPRIELRSGAVAQLAASLHLTHRRPVWPVGSHRLVSVAGEHDPGRQRDLVACEAVRVTAAVPTFILVPDRARNLAEAGDSAEDPLADHGVLAHQRQLTCVQRAWLEQNLRQNPELADIVQDRHVAELLEVQQDSCPVDLRPAAPGWRSRWSGDRCSRRELKRCGQRHDHTW
jgi:hypothetical protein